jgi:hypothetical protein
VGNPSIELRWCALALGFASCALLWICVALDDRGVLPTTFKPAAWECTLLSELQVPRARAMLLLLYNLCLTSHCSLWLLITRRPSERLGRVLASTVSEDYSPLSTTMFNSKQAYLWLVLIVGGGLHFPNDLVSITLYSETLHTFKSVVLNLRLCSVLLEGRHRGLRWLAQSVAALPPVVGTMSVLAWHLSGRAPLQGDTGLFSARGLWTAPLLDVALLFTSGIETLVDGGVAFATWRTASSPAALDDPLLAREPASASWSAGQMPRGVVLLLRVVFFFSAAMVAGASWYQFPKLVQAGSLGTWTEHQSAPLFWHPRVDDGSWHVSSIHFVQGDLLHGAIAVRPDCSFLCHAGCLWWCWLFAGFCHLPHGNVCAWTVCACHVRPK